MYVRRLRNDVTPQSVPAPPEQLPDPKQALINLARRSRFRQIREALVPAQNSTARVGFLYVTEMTRFARDGWDVQAARNVVSSLDRCLLRLEQFQGG